MLDNLSLSDFRRIDRRIQALRQTDEQRLISIGKVDRRREDTYKGIEDLFR